MIICPLHCWNKQLADVDVVVVEEDVVPMLGATLVTNNVHSKDLQEHLTKRNKDLLKEAKATYKDVGFVYPGYVHHGEIRAKLNAESTYKVIKSSKDIQALLLKPSD